MRNRAVVTATTRLVQVGVMLFSAAAVNANRMVFWRTLKFAIVCRSAIMCRA